MVEPANYPNRLNQPRGQHTDSTVGGRQRFNMVERKDPELIQFSIGQVETGILIASVRGTVGGKPGIRWVIEDMETKRVGFFWGTHQINSKLRFNDVGHVIEVTCLGEEDTGQGNKMKVFKVRVSEFSAPGWAKDGTPITDDDLPPAEAYS